MSIVESICQELDARRNVALVHIVEQLASAPRHSASMLVGERGLVAGTVGGGDLEARAIEAGMRVAEKGVAEFMDYEMTGESAAASGMICGGSMRLFIEPIRPDSRTGVLYRRLAIALACGDDMFSVTPLRAPGQRLLCRTKMRTWHVPAEIQFLVRQKMEEGAFKGPFELKDSRGQRFVVEPWPAPWRLVLAGGGHVAQAVAKIAAMTDFAVSVIDDREEFATSELFPMAAVVRQAEDYEDCFAGMSLEDKSFVVILTRGHLFDRKVLVQALRSKASYIGMIGSRRKIGAIFGHLREHEGFDEKDLARVTAPIGLDIGAETPEEIAVSVMAQLIAARALMHGGRRHLQSELAGQVCGHPKDPAEEAARETPGEGSA